MQNLFSYLVNDILVWVVVGFTAQKVMKSVSKGEVGQAVVAAVLGSCAYYFLKNPVTVLDWGSNIVSKIFGG